MSRTSAECGISPSMDFPIVDLFDDDLSTAWLWKYFHQKQSKCPHCGRSVWDVFVNRKQGYLFAENRATPSPSSGLWAVWATRSVVQALGAAAGSSPRRHCPQLIIPFIPCSSSQPLAACARGSGTTRRRTPELIIRGSSYRQRQRRKEEHGTAPALPAESES